MGDAPVDRIHLLRGSIASRRSRTTRFTTARSGSPSVVEFVSAPAFHGITDQIPKKVWIAIGRNDWTPKPSDMPIRVLRFSDDLLVESVETQVIEGVSVKVFGVAKTAADCFRHRGKIGLSVALEGLREALRQRKTTPAEISEAADTGGIGTVIRPCLEALTSNGYCDIDFSRLAE